MKIYGLVGAGGFGREVLPLVVAMLKNELPAASYKIFFVQEQAVTTPEVNTYPVLTVEQFLAYPASEKYFNVTIATYEVRKRIAERMRANAIQAFQITAATALDLGPNVLGEGAILCPFTILTANAKIGKYFHANLYSYVAHDCIIGDYVTFAPGVHCNGNVIIEDYAYIGTGAVIKQGTPEKPLIIGKGAIVGMGAVVTKNVAAFETVVGNPAQLFKRKEATLLSA